MSLSATRRFWAANSFAANLATPTLTHSLKILWRARATGSRSLLLLVRESPAANRKQAMWKRAGLLATQGIRGGANREVLKRIKKTGDIFFAKVTAIGFWPVQMSTCR